MNDLALAKSANFGQVQCDFYRNSLNEILMTREQIGAALEYTSPADAIRKIHERHKSRLDKFSVQDKLAGTDGKQYLTYLYTAKGLYEICRWSQQPKADAFMDWAWDVIEDIRKHGAYATDDVIDNILKNPDFGIKLLTELKQEREEKKALEFANKQKDQLIGELKPKADYVDKILKNTGLVTITQIAKDYGMSGEKMNSLLHELGVQYKQSGQWLLYTKYQDKGYTHSQTVDITRSDGRPDIKMNTKWTQKGRLFLYDLLKVNGLLPVIERKEEQAS